MRSCIDLVGQNTQTFSTLVFIGIGPLYARQSEDPDEQRLERGPRLRSYSYVLLAQYSETTSAMIAA